MAKKVKHEISLTAGQAGEVLAPIIEVVLRMKSRDAQYWIGKKGKLANEVKKILVRSNGNESEFANLIPDWQNFYKNLFGLNLDLSDIAIPDKPTEGNWRLLVIANITLETLYAKCKEKFRCWRWTNDNFDKIVIYNERDAKNGSYAIWVKDEVEADEKYKNLSANRIYAIWVRDEIEADEKYKNLSANQIKSTNIKTETLAERLIHELKHFQETGKHLDIKNITLCAGSRYSDGDVPGVRWRVDDGMYIKGFNPGSHYDDLRAREAVS